jgi:hypothetical protein
LEHFSSVSIIRFYPRRANPLPNLAAAGFIAHHRITRFAGKCRGKLRQV